MNRRKILYVTSNDRKFNSAKTLMSSLGIEITQAKVDIPEIQSDSLEEIAIDKAERAFKILKHPLFINDAGWIIPALNGFPGPYMKFINQWFTPDDFINLMQGQKNRQVILRDTIVYVDKEGTKIFSYDNKGVMLRKIRGKEGPPSNKVISLSDSGLSISEENEKGIFFLESERKIWEEFSTWLNNK